ncbi:Hypothetical predicted protein [Scomber scombrus]|uniref:Uncharacterized protein n=1 Tax=Scomber scombrus TaxID=13677 RepID=A0AAV1PG03_SCOSC
MDSESYEHCSIVLMRIVKQCLWVSAASTTGTYLSDTQLHRHASSGLCQGRCGDMVEDLDVEFRLNVDLLCKENTTENRDATHPPSQVAWSGNTIGGEILPSAAPCEDDPHKLYK